MKHNYTLVFKCKERVNLSGYENISDAQNDLVNLNSQLNKLMHCHFHLDCEVSMTDGITGVVKHVNLSLTKGKWSLEVQAVERTICMKPYNMITNVRSRCG